MVKEMSLTLHYHNSCLRVAFMENDSLYIIVFKGIYEQITRFISVLSGVRIPAPPLCKQRGYGFSRSPFFVKNGCLLVAQIEFVKPSKNQHIK